MLCYQKLKSRVRPAAPPKANLGRILVILCVSALVLSGAWFITSCAQSKQAVEQNQQTRPRRAVSENTSALPASANTKNSNNLMNDMDEAKSKPVAFYTALDAALAARGKRLKDVCDRNDAVEQRILEDYGAVFIAADKVLPPPVCIFKSEKQVIEFQTKAGFKAESIGGTTIELQRAAMEALLAARAEALREGLNITPRGGSEAGRRSYEDTRRLWDTRFLPALAYWNKRGRLTKEKVAQLKGLSLSDQVREVLELEKTGIFFSKDFSKSILYSIAAPGTSQHIMMLALDVEQFANERVRRILARHGWFQTVKSDLPHFTYLGLEEKELPSRGLRSVKSGSQLFWIPNVGGTG